MRNIFRRDNGIGANNAVWRIA